ncbi:hypothetical protein [Alicyclobacillus acidiphilus]|uniref:hypothetical protein n=1 Tax=Alicyclobacillus acidiphilus TaxID=182455 RepID=UPI00082AD25C|nr:hypothetical protein [Alicyclobacillus acidiphilus]
MFIVTCTNCGATREWTTGVLVGQARIQVAGFSVYGRCGQVVTEEEGTVLREFVVPLDDGQIDE